VVTNHVHALALKGGLPTPSEVVVCFAVSTLEVVLWSR